MSTLFFYKKDGITKGPITLVDLLQVASLETLIMQEGSSNDWIAIKDSPILMNALTNLNKSKIKKSPPPLPKYPTKAPPAISSFNKKDGNNEKKINDLNLKEPKTLLNNSNTEKKENLRKPQNQNNYIKANESNKGGGMFAAILLFIIVFIAAGLYFLFENNSISTNKYNDTDYENIRKKRRSREKIENIEYNNEVRQKAEPMPLYQQCINCDGTGFTNKECGWCQGSGIGTSGTADCSWCNGRGYDKEKCSACYGEKRVRVN